MELKLTRIDDDFYCETKNSDGKSVFTDAPVSKGGGNKGMRPMELILAGLATCSSFDIISILKKSQQAISSFEVEVTAVRQDTIPQIFTNIYLTFKVKGKISEEKLAHAIELSVHKYCSVATMLKHTTKIHTKYTLVL